MATREQRGVFGEVADDYDRIRPGYPGSLVDEVLAAAGPGPVLEVGAGTGKATVAFAARGVSLTCIEPDPRMAELLRRKLPGVPIVVDARHGLAPETTHSYLAAGFAEPAAFEEEWAQLGLRAEQFPERRHVRYHSARSYSSADYRTHLLSTSMYRILHPAVRDAAVAGTAAVIDAHGGTIDFEILTDVVLARRI
jgi:hypothetical protein